MGVKESGSREEPPLPGSLLAEFIPTTPGKARRWICMIDFHFSVRGCLLIMFLLDKKFYLANIGVVSLTPGVEAGWTPGKQVVEGGAPSRPNNQKKVPLNRSEPSRESISLPKHWYG
jgi:hypothetical protein